VNRVKPVGLGARHGALPPDWKSNQNSEIN